MQGTITYWNEPKGFGFVRNDADEDCFIHISDVSGENIKVLHKGDRIRYDVVDTSRGKKGVRVELIYPSK